MCPEPEGPGASTSRVADRRRGWCFGMVAWFKSLCVWAARAHQRAGSPVVRRLRPPGWAARPTTVVSSGVGCVCVATPWLVREPRGWGFRRGCGGGGWGAGVWWAGSRAQARGQLATVRHAHRVSTQLKPTQQASGLFLASVARKPSPALTQPSAGGVCKQPAQPVANEDAEHARFSDSRLLSRGRANCWKSFH